MSERKWNAWFLLSTLWFFIHFVITICVSDIQELGRNWLFLGGYILSVANLMFCVYIGCEPSESNY